MVGGRRAIGNVSEVAASDGRWFWIAPMLLDAQFFPDFTRAWWQFVSGLLPDNSLTNQAKDIIFV